MILVASTFPEYACRKASWAHLARVTYMREAPPPAALLPRHPAGVQQLPASGCELSAAALRRGEGAERERRERRGRRGVWKCVEGNRRNKSGACREAEADRGRLADGGNGRTGPCWSAPETGNKLPEYFLKSCCRGRTKFTLRVRCTGLGFDRLCCMGCLGSSFISLFLDPAMASGDPAAWAARRQAKIEAARALRAEHRDGLTEQHTFHPKCVARRPASCDRGPEHRARPSAGASPPTNASVLLPRRIPRQSSRGASPGLSRLPNEPEGSGSGSGSTTCTEARKVKPCSPSLQESSTPRQSGFQALPGAAPPRIPSVRMESGMSEVADSLAFEGFEGFEGSGSLAPLLGSSHFVAMREAQEAPEGEEARRPAAVGTVGTALDVAMPETHREARGGGLQESPTHKISMLLSCAATFSLRVAWVILRPASRPKLVMPSCPLFRGSHLFCFEHIVQCLGTHSRVW